MNLIQIGSKNVVLGLSCFLCISTFSTATPPDIVQAQNQTLEPEPESSDEFFGKAMSMDGNRLIVGSPLWINPEQDEKTGAAKIFEFDSTAGQWFEHTPLTPVGSDNDESRYGDAVASVGDINCDGVVDVGDLLEVVSYWGGDCGSEGLGIPRTVQDCLNRFPPGSLQLQKCLEVIEWLESQGQ